MEGAAAERLAEARAIRERALGPDAGPIRLRELLDDPDAEVRAAAAEAAGAYPEDPELFERLLAAARDGEADDAVREEALGALGRVVREGVLAGAEEEGYAPDAELGEPPADLYGRVKALLLEVLADAGRTDGERRRALESLAWLSDAAPVADALSRRAEAGVDRSALLCMGRSGDGARWGERIVASLGGDGPPEVLAQAAEAAASAEVAGAVEPLERLLASRAEPWVRRRTAAALGRLAGRDAEAALRRAAEQDDEEEVREAAGRALAELDLLEADAASPETHATGSVTP